MEFVKLGLRLHAILAFLQERFLRFLGILGRFRRIERLMTCDFDT